MYDPQEEEQFWNSFGYMVNFQKVNGMTTMNKILSKYIHNIIIDEHADKEAQDGYSFNISDLPIYEVYNFLDMLLKYDPSTREIILDRMQELVESELPNKESVDRYDAGFVPRIDPTNGETIWEKY